MTYRVIIAGGGDGEAPNGSYVTVNGRRDPSGYDFATLDEAKAVRDRFTDMFPDVTYVLVGRPEGLTWDDIALAYGATAVHTEPEPDDDDDDVELCEHCDEPADECYGHTFYECAECGWGCEVPDCDECLYYSDDYDDLLCESCYDETQRRESGPGVSVRTMSCCGSSNVHHDDIVERFVCDCEARRILAEKRPVTLAYPLPTATLEVA